MRNSTQVETREIADSDLDSISGGISISGGAGIGFVGVSGGVEVDGVGTLVGTVESTLSGAWVSGAVGI
jgi:hypothetical protein